ncbi:MAG: AMP-binding protein, partial [Phycisphaeraceae bacterium]|nr:AMP-binding protein [Phycisphaeraceae bacterium]
MPGTTWFEGARLNFAENLLRRRDDKTALIEVHESGSERTISYAELARLAANFAAFLRDRGVQPGDRVAAILPNRIEAIAAMLGATRLGAIWSSCSPDFGFKGIMDRFGQIEPTVLVACDGYTYGGKPFSSIDRIAAVREQIPSLRDIVLVDVIGSDRTA